MTIEAALAAVAARRVTSTPVARAAANAMAASMRRATAGPVGSDLRMSRFSGGPVTFTVSATAGRATVAPRGPTFALADRGRLQPPGARGGSWRGFHITQAAAPEALRAGVSAARAAVARR